MTRLQAGILVICSGCYGGYRAFKSGRKGKRVLRTLGGYYVGNVIGGLALGLLLAGGRVGPEIDTSAGPGLYGTENMQPPGAMLGDYVTVPSGLGDFVTAKGERMFT